MAKNVYIGIGGTARKVKKIYVGVANVARKVKKAYIGVGGVARCFWSGGELSYYGTATALSATMYPAATTVGNYALFGGTKTSASASSVVNAYSNTLTRSVPTALSEARKCINATWVGSYALFGPGTNASATESNVVDVYNTSLTRTTTTWTKREWYGAAHVGDYAVFAAGYNTTDLIVSSGLAYNSSLTKTGLYLSASRRQLSGASVAGVYAIFGGGYTGSNTGATNAIDASLTVTTLDSTSSVQEYVGISSDNYAILAGGQTYEGFCTSSVYAYDSSLTRTKPTALGTGVSYAAGTAVGDFAIITGGQYLDGNYDTQYSNTTYVYDASLVQTIGTSMSVQRHAHNATTVGSYAIFAGGATEGKVASATPDVYTA